MKETGNQRLAPPGSPAQSLSAAGGDCAHLLDSEGTECPEGQACLPQAQDLLQPWVKAGVRGLAHVHQSHAPGPGLGPTHLSLVPPVKARAFSGFNLTPVPWVSPALPRLWKPGPNNDSTPARIPGRSPGRASSQNTWPQVPDLQEGPLSLGRPPAHAGARCPPPDTGRRTGGHRHSLLGPGVQETGASGACSQAILKARGGSRGPRAQVTFCWGKLREPQAGGAGRENSHSRHAVYI